MSRSFGDIAFTPAVQTVQIARGSRRAYAAQAARADGDDQLGGDEVAFIEARDSFYLASVGENGWPYVQHRGGPVGFLRMLDRTTIGFADFSGNRQYVSVGNVSGDDRVCLFLMDYPHRTRLKIYGHARLTEDADEVARFVIPEYRSPVERAWVIRVAAFDWNCQKYITPRFTVDEIEGFLTRVTAPLEARIAELEAELAKARG
jgi:predicted pyridoxine 5'-phosphate oxidase superfamily flavin-nucleotide-binding protein